MADFASAAMLQILAAGLRGAGLQAPPLPAERGTLVALAAKRALVESAVRQGGLALLPLLGRGVRLLPRGPLHQALLVAPSGAELITRWQRLERYIHSRHRVLRLEAGTTTVLLEHRSLQPGEPPLAAEDLVVLGVLSALLELIGAQAVQAEAGGAPAYPAPDAAALQQAAKRGSTSRWALRWVMPAPAQRAEAASGPANSPAPDPGPIGQALALIKTDLMAAWPVATLAGRLGLSTRSWQRQLAAAGLGQAALLQRARCEAAAAALVSGDTSLAELGFACGFADQAHFTRRFRAHVGLTPGRYREAFAAG
jgi:AraC-like DNA-binding protein